MAVVSLKEEEVPLKTEGINVKEFVKNTVKIELPRLANDGSYVFLDKSNQRGFCQNLSGCCQDILEDLTSKFPGVQAFLCKYAIDFLTQLIYIGGVAVIQTDLGGIISSQIGTKPRALGGSFDANTLIFDGSSASLQAQKEQALQWWILLSGVISGLILVLKNMWLVACQFSDMVDQMKVDVNKAIDALQAVIHHETQDLLKTSFSQPVAGVLSPPITSAIATQIDGAQKDLDLHALLPWPIAHRVNSMISFGAPCVLFVILAGYYHYLTGPLHKHSRRLVEFDAASSSNSNQSIQDFMSTHLQLVWNLALNTLWGVVSSWPVLRFMTNLAINVIQYIVNRYLLQAVTSKLDMDGLQKGVDWFSEPTCTTHCTTCAVM